MVRWALKKMLLLERDPEAGEGLLGSLIGYRKLVVRNRDWRIVWRVTHDATGGIVLDVAEVWCFGARADAEVYDEVTRRIAQAGASPRTRALSEVLELLGKTSRGLQAATEPATLEGGAGAGDDGARLPAWLPQVLTSIVGLSQAEVSRMSLEQAQARWAAYTRSET